MITRITKDRLEEAAKLAFESNKHPESTCKSMAVEYEKILEKFKDYHNKGESDFLVYIEDDKIKGVCNFDPELDDKYVQTAGGIFASEDFGTIAEEFYNFLIEKYQGYEFYSSYTTENVNANKFWLSKGAKLDFDAEIYELYLGDVTDKSVDRVTELKEDDFDSFKKLHNERSKDAWWNGDRMIIDGKLMGKFQVHVIKDENEIIGYIASRVTSSYSETYFVYAKDNEYSILLDLFNAVQHYVSKTNKGQHQYFVERENSVEKHAVEEAGYKRVGSNSTYYIKKL